MFRNNLFKVGAGIAVYIAGKKVSDLGLEQQVKQIVSDKKYLKALKSDKTHIDSDIEDILSGKTSQNVRTSVAYLLKSQEENKNHILHTTDKLNKKLVTLEHHLFVRESVGFYFIDKKLQKNPNLISEKTITKKLSK